MANQTPFGTEHIFADTSALYAAYAEDDDHHKAAQAFLRALDSTDFYHNRLIVTPYVLSELATLTLYEMDHDAAVTLLDECLSHARILVYPIEFDSGIPILPAANHQGGIPIFHSAITNFKKFSDNEISMVDHITSVCSSILNSSDSTTTSGQFNPGPIFAFDDDFEILGHRILPEGMNIKPYM